MSIWKNSIFEQKWCESISNEYRTKYGASTEQVRSKYRASTENAL